MAGFKSDSQSNAVLDFEYGSGTPATLYCALSTSTPTSSGSGFTEPVGNGYARVAVTNNATNFPAAASKTKHNGTTITFPAATGAGWGTITWAGWYDAASGGNFRGAGPLGTAKTVASGDTLSFAASAFTATES